MDRPIPAFYCVYLLRSSMRPSRPADFYIGSTPNPLRRQKQHNGISRGGAKRTERIQKRPWNICLAVSGFPSKISALQFEWAWQHTYKSRHLAPELRALAAQGTKQRQLSKKGKLYTRTLGPRRELPALIKDLSLLLSSQSFARLQLLLEIFHQDVHMRWQKQALSKKIDSLTTMIAGGSSLPTDTSCLPIRQHKVLDAGRTHLDKIETSYAPFERLILSNLSRLSSDDVISCSFCASEMDKKETLFILCPNDNCHVASHITCMGNYLLKHESSESCILPQTGVCPSCEQHLIWPDLMRELSLRIRGKEKVKKLIEAKNRDPSVSSSEGIFKPPRVLSLLDDSDDGEHLDDGWFSDEAIVKVARIHRSCLTQGPNLVFQHEEVASNSDSFEELSE